MALNSQAGSEFRLLAEPEDSTQLEEVSHWLQVYQELLGGFRGIAASEPGAHRRARQLQVDRLEERFVFWERRYHDLLAASRPDQADLENNRSERMNSPVTRNTK
jgi:hypothetical protein